MKLRPSQAAFAATGGNRVRPAGRQGPTQAMRADERVARRKATMVGLVDRTTVGDGPDAKRTRLLLPAAIQRLNTDGLTARGGKSVLP